MSAAARLAVITAAGLTLAACGQAAPSSTTPPATRAPTTAAAAAPLTCKQKSDQWRQANLRTLRRFKAAVAPFATGTVTSAQARRLSAAAQAAENVPPPACADPKGYYGQAMANLVTAGDAAAGGGALSELGALGPMENADTALNELGAELRQTIGSSRL